MDVSSNPHNGLWEKFRGKEFVQHKSWEKNQISNAKKSLLKPCFKKTKDKPLVLKHNRRNYVLKTENPQEKKLIEAINEISKNHNERLVKERCWNIIWAIKYFKANPKIKYGLLFHNF